MAVLRFQKTLQEKNIFGVFNMKMAISSFSFKKKIVFDGRVCEVRLVLMKQNGLRF